MERGVRSALVRMHGSRCCATNYIWMIQGGIIICIQISICTRVHSLWGCHDLDILHTSCRISNYTIDLRCTWPLLGLLLYKNCQLRQQHTQELLWQAKAVNVVPCQFNAKTSIICICSGTVLGCHEAEVRTLPSSHLRRWRRPSFSSVLGNGRQLVIRHLLWTRLGVKRAKTTMQCQLADYTHETKCESWFYEEHSQQVPNCERSRLPWSCSPTGFGVQLAGGLSDFDGSPSPEAQSPPGGRSSILIRRCVPDRLQIANHSLGGSGCSPALPTHVIACDLVRLYIDIRYLWTIYPRTVRRNAAVLSEQDLESADGEGYTVESCPY